MIQEFIDSLSENEKDIILLNCLEEMEINGMVIFPSDGSEPTINGEKLRDGI